ncbi:MAG: nickel-responsive transcriptional regulator NikR [bacterium]|nr:nickel-responsive transcriptional regulator NikR [bacterium]
MPGLVRFGIAIEKEILTKFDALVRSKSYPTRSKAILNLIRQEIMSGELSNDSAEVVGSIDLVYDHHKRQLLNKITDIQHDYQKIILASQHMHLDHNRCYEIIVVKGEKKSVEQLASKIKATKGVDISSLRLVAAKQVK